MVENSQLFSIAGFKNAVAWLNNAIESEVKKIIVYFDYFGSDYFARNLLDHEEAENVVDELNEIQQMKEVAAVVDVQKEIKNAARLKIVGINYDKVKFLLHD